MAAACFSLPESPWVQLDQRQRIRRFLSFLLMITLIIFWPEEELKLVHYEALASRGTVGAEGQKALLPPHHLPFSGPKKASVSLVSPVISFFHVPLGILRATRLLDEPSEVFLEIKYALSCSARNSHGGAEMDSTTVTKSDGRGASRTHRKGRRRDWKREEQLGHVLYFCSRGHAREGEEEKKKREKSWNNWNMKSIGHPLEIGYISPA